MSYDVDVATFKQIDVPRLARRLARWIAKVGEGAAVEASTGRVLFRTHTEIPYKRAIPEERIDVIELAWVLPFKAKDDDAIPGKLLELLARQIGEAVPTRCGEWEPLRRIDPGHAFEDAWVHAMANDSTLFWGARPPCFSGHVSTTSPGRFPGRPIMRVEVILDGRAARSEPWLDAIRHLFIEGCRVLPVFYAAAYVCQNVIAKGRSLRYDGQSESGPMGLLSWNGILREPMWLTYLGPQLAQLLNDGPNWADWTPSGNGALIQSSRTPRPSRDLVGVVPPLPDSLASASRAIDPDG